MKYLAKEKIMVAFAALTILFSAAFANAATLESNQKFQKVVHICGLATGTGTFSGKDYSNCKGIVDGDLWDIPANTVIEKVYMIIDTAFTGTTALTIGDDDSATGFATDNATLGSVGLNFWGPTQQGAYLRVRGNNTVNADGPNAKYYSAAGKEVKLDVTTTNTAGKARIFIEGYKIPAP